jgi:precorrin-3B synthase
MSGQTRGACPTLFEPMRTGDGLLVRVKPPLGRLDAAAARKLAEAARRFGNGRLELTNRGALQVRGLSEQTLAPFREAMLAAALASADAAVERRRNLVLSPLAGDAESTLAGELERWIAQDHALAALPPKFAFAVGTVSDPYRLPGDVRLVADAATPPPSRFASHLPRCTGEERGAAVPPRAGELSAKLTEGAFWRIGLGGDVDGLTLDPLPAVQTIVGAFLRLRAQLPDPPRRMTDLVRHSGVEAFFAGADVKPTETTAAPAASTIAGALGEVFALGLAFGAITAEGLSLAADLAERFADGPLRLSPWRALFLTGVSDAAQLAADATGFVVAPTDPCLRVNACAGAPACASAHAATRDDAVLAAARRLAGDVHLSGCAKGCAHPGPAAITLVAAPDGYGLVRNGRAGDSPELRGLTLEHALLAAEIRQGPMS